MKTRKILFLFLACSLTFLETKAGTLLSLIHISEPTRPY